ncbi:MAG: hypothetical protein IJ385_06590 [Ruminiclostridium sp.]|nr:hypothetical protein [Ruminiclostridium sp.]
MKKIIAALLAGAMILSLAGCSGEDKDTSETTENNKKEEVAFQSEDTTDESVKYLREEVPLFSKYLETRMKYPLTYEVEVTSANGVQTAGIYIFDKNTICNSTTDAHGNVTKTIYDGTKCYFISDVDKIIYYSEVSEAGSENIVSTSLMKIHIEDAMNSSYTTGETKEYNGETYKYETITSGETVAEYYFDEITDELAYVIAGGNITKVTRLDNEKTPSVLELPEDYERKPLEEYLAQVAAEQAAAEQASAE